MSRYIDADKIVYTWLIDEDGEEHDGVTLQSIIRKMPTPDVVEVVRCKDCKYMLQYEQIRACCKVNNFLQEPKCVSDNDFCSRGERKDA